MLIREIMTKEVISVYPDSLVQKVAELLISHRIHAVPVLENNVPVGIITETDFFTKGSMKIYLPEYINFIKKDNKLGKISAQGKEKMQKLANTQAKDIMSQPCLTINEDAEVEDFFELVKSEKLISVPVVNRDKELVGIITRGDIIGAFVK